MSIVKQGAKYAHPELLRYMFNNYQKHICYKNGSYNLLNDAAKGSF